MGRPPKYRVEHCEMLVQHMAGGLSFESFAAVIGTHRDTLYDWEHSHPEFSDAKKRAVESGRIFWEKMGLGGMSGKIKGFNSAVWIFNMKNRFKWRDNIELTGDANNPLAVAAVPPVVFKIDKE